jgi:hypothetical protein
MHEPEGQGRSVAGDGPRPGTGHEVAAGGPAPPAASGPGASPEAAEQVAAVREELRRLGYLSHRLDRYLLQDALRPQHRPAELARMALRVGLLAGVPLALAGGAALGAANGAWERAPLDLLVLAVHLLAPMVALVAAAAFVLSSLLTLLLRRRPGRRVEPICLALATVGGLAAAGEILLLGRELLAGAQWPLRLVFVVVLVLVSWGLIRVLYDALLALAIRLTALPPRERFGFGSRWVAAAVGLVAVGALAAAALIPQGAREVPPPAFFPTHHGEPVVLLGLDGVRADELDYLLAVGALPELGRLRASGAVMASYRRDPEQPAAAFWTSVATGLTAPEHGVASYDSLEPLGVTTPLSRLGPMRWYWRGVATPLGLAEYRPVLASRRRAWALWELAARGGLSAVAVNWWSTYPAEPLTGAVVAHGAYQLASVETSASIAASGEMVAELLALRAETVASALAAPLAAVAPADASALAERAIRPDAFYRAAAERLATVLRPGLVAVYLPAVDLAADGWPGSDLAFADLVRAELAAADGLLARLVERAGTVAVVVDAGRRGDGEGRVLLWRRDGCQATPAMSAAEASSAPAAGTVVPAEGSADGSADRSTAGSINGSTAGSTAGSARGSGLGSTDGSSAPQGSGLPELAPESLASGLLLALGLPRSAELPAPVAHCRWPPAPALLPTFGERAGTTTSAEASEEYLRNLQSLGYL